MFFVALQFRGGLADGTMLSNRGPRHQGHASDGILTPETENAAALAAAR
jgi:hypothetical protein